MDDDGMRIDELEELLDRLAADGRRPKFIYSVPTFQNPAGVTLSAERRRRLVEIARERELLRGRGQPLRPAALRGRADRAALRARRRRLRRLPRHLLEDPLPRDPPRLALRAAAGDGEGRARQAGRGPLHLDPHPVLRRRVLRRGALARLHRRPDRHLPRAAATRCSRRSSATSPSRRAGPRPRAACSCGRRCPTTSTPPTCWPGRCARTSPSSPAPPPSSTRARAPPRCGSTSPAPSEDEIREGIRRIGKVVAEQVELFETITGEHQPAALVTPEQHTDEIENVLPFRPRADEGRGAQGRAARWSARSRCARARGSRTRSRSLGHEVVAARRRRRRWSSALKARAARRRLHRPARARRRGRHRPGAARDPRHPLHRAPASPPACAASTRCAAKHDAARRRRRPRPTGSRSTPTGFRELGAAERARGDRGAPRLPAGGQARRAGLGAGRPLRRRARRRAGGAGRRLLLRRPGAARAPRRRARAGGGGARRRGAAARRGPPPRGGPLQLRGPLRDRAHRLRLPRRARPAGEADAVARRSRARLARRSGARASPAST